MQDSNGQVQETVIDQEQSVTDQVSQTSEAEEQLGKLLNPETASEPEPTQEAKLPEESNEAEVEPEQEQAIPVIDDNIIRDFPQLRMYKGKPVKDLAPAYALLVSKLTQSQQELKKLKQELANSSTSKIPDQVEDPEGFKKWLEEYTEQIKSSVQVKPQVDWTQEVSRYLPPEADVNKVVEAFKDFNSVRFYDELGQVRPEVEQFYNQNPEVLLNELSRFYQMMSKAEKNEMSIQQESKKKAYDTVKTSLKKANKEKENLQSAAVNVIPRNVELTDEEKMLLNIGLLAQQE